MLIPLKAILWDIRSALNVGAMFRTADAVGMEELVLAGITPYPPHNRIPKTALGAENTVNWQHFKEKEAALKHVSGSHLVAVELTKEAIPYTHYQFPQNTTLVFGNEISGVPEFVTEQADATVIIPMRGQKESLNVATSFGIIVYEILRQWEAKS